VKKASDLTVKDWVLGGALGGLAGFLLGYLAKTPITQWKQQHGIDPSHGIHHADIGGTIATLGAISAHTNPLAPGVVGFGAGLAIEDYADELGIRVFRQAKTQPEVFMQSEFQTTRPTTTWKHVPDFPRSARYGAMVEAIRGIIYEDANHPEVRGTAEQIIKEAGLDGRDTEAILTAFTFWIRRNTTYIHDPARDMLGRPSDMYKHAYLVLPQSPTNPKGTATGDCDCLFILWAAMALSVGIENIVGILVAQQKEGIYNHILPGLSSTPNPHDIREIQGYELTEDKPIGWIPPAKSYGFLLL